VQAALKEAARGYKDHGWNGPVPMLDAEGGAVVFPSYKSREQLGDHDLMLPLPENQEKAMAAWIEAEKTKKVATRYHQARKNSRNKAVGAELRYQGFEFGSDRGNPWESVGRQLFGEQFITEAQNKLIEEAKEIIAGADTFEMAVKAAQWTLRDNWHPKFPFDIRQALIDKARTLGVHDKPMDDVLTLSEYRGFNPWMFGIDPSYNYRPTVEKVLRQAQ